MCFMSGEHREGRFFAQRVVLLMRVLQPVHALLSTKY
jgi:hypothetical protein